MTPKYKTNYFFSFTFIISILFSSILSAEEFEGVIAWSKRVELSTPVSGVVQKVFSQSSNIIAKGEVLIQLDPRTFKADLKYAKAQLVSSYGRQQEANRELHRQLDMYDRGMLSEHDLQVAKNNSTTTEAQYSQAQSSLTKAKINLEYSAIRAPFNAIVINTMAVKGRVVAASMNPPILVVVAEAHRMLVQFNIAADMLTRMSLKQPVKVSVAGNIYQGSVTAIALEQNANQAYTVDVIFDNKKDLLRAGQKAKVSF